MSISKASAQLQADFCYPASLKISARMQQTTSWIDSLSRKSFHSWTQCLWKEDYNGNQGKLNATIAPGVTTVTCHSVICRLPGRHLTLGIHLLVLPKPLQLGPCNCLTGLDSPKSIPFASFRTQLKCPLFGEAIPSWRRLPNYFLSQYFNHL